MAKKGGKSKNKSKAKGGAAAAKKVADTPAAVVPSQEVEETVPKSDGEAEIVVTDAGAAVTADASSALPDTVAEGTTTTAPPADFTPEASNATESPLTEVDEPATEAVPEEEPVAVAGTTTTLPERPKDTVAEPESNETHVKRPYESSLTTKEEDHKPPKIPRVEDALDTTSSAKALEPTEKETAGAAAIPAGETTIQPQMVPGLGTDPSDNVDKDLEAPGLSKDTATPLEALAPTSSTTEPVVTDSVIEKKAAEEPVAPASTAPVSEANVLPLTEKPEAPVAEEFEALDVAPETTKEVTSTEPSTAAVATEPAPVVSSSVTDADAKATDAAATSATDSAPAAGAQKPLQIAEEQVDAATAKAPEEKLDAAKAQAPEESAGASKVEETQPTVTESQPASAATDAQKTEEAPSSETKPQETPAAQDTQTEGAPTGQEVTSEGAAAINEPENKSATDQAKDTAKLAANRAQESAKSEAAKGGAEKRKSGIWSWLKRKVKGDKN